ncbi:IclR family transcriptional regulator [Pseudonocardia spinosispora]|uniref:IclR family transcriptional regulator n=1 Tax=Pseudonocardia spinosispora TaxID=103441 RepID=UPI0004252A49|nr:IclR family transcriptional regulator [Pseudonocardia spinosispora]
MADAKLSTVRNAARLLKTFLPHEEELGVAELARRLGLGKSSVHRLLATLLDEGLLERDPRTGRYRLGIVMFELGEAVRVHMDLHAAAGAALIALRERTGESAQVAILDVPDVVYVDRVESPHTFRLYTDAGRRAPLHCTSSGKLLLAHRPDADQDAFLATARLEPVTRHTVIDAEQLRVELATIRSRGWAESVNERQIGLASIAAPIRDLTGEVVAAISAGAPLSRFQAVARKRLTQAVVDAGQTASRRLGWSPQVVYMRES